MAQTRSGGLPSRGGRPDPPRGVTRADVYDFHDVLISSSVTSFVVKEGSTLEESLALGRVFDGRHFEKEPSGME